MAAASRARAGAAQILIARLLRRGCALAAVALLCDASTTGAQPYAPLDVPDSLMTGALRSVGPGFENTWNALLVSELRAHAEGDRSAPTLRRLMRRITVHEEPALGSHIARDALALRDRWTADQRRARVRAAVAESLATAAQSARDWPHADSLFNLALADYRLVRESRRIAWVLGSLGVVAFQSGDYARADSVYRLALTARERLGDPRMIGNTLNSLGVLYYLAGQHAEARSWFERARTLRERGGERGPLGATLNYLGLVQRELGHPDSARTYLDLALASTVAAGDSARTAEVLVNSVGLLTASGEHGEALRRGERAAAIYRELGNLRGEAQLQSNLGTLLRQQARFSDAIEHYQRSLALCREARDVRGLIQTLLSLGQLGVMLGDPETGLPALQEAVSLADSLRDHRSRSAARNNLALLAEMGGDLAGAERHALTALEIAESVADTVLMRETSQTLGGLALGRRDLATARTWYERAAAGDPDALTEQRAADLNNLGIVAVYQDSLEVAEQRFHSAVRVADVLHAPDLRWPPMLGLGEVAERRGDFARALALDRQAALLIDTLRSRQGEEAPSIVLLAERRLAAEALIHLLVRLQPRFPDSAFVAEAFTWSERVRARSLADLMAASRRDQALALVDVERLRAALPAGTAYLQYSLGDSSSTLWVVTRDALRCHPLPPRNQLRPRIEILRRALDTPTAAGSRTAIRSGRSLYRTLLEPAERSLTRVKHLLISPDGPLALIPFEALLTKDVPRDDPALATGYLVERWSVTYVPSASVWMALSRRERGGAILALGDPQFHRTADSADARLPALPYTGQEIEALERLAGNRPIRTLRAAGATRDALLSAPELSSASILHLASHAIASEYEPRQAGLWLAADPDGVPGFLSVADVLGLSLAADLVTLSACETGIGRVARGEGVLGLPRAMLAAGATSVLASLWKVNDRSAAELMTTFYRELLVGGRPAHDALASAKRALLRNRETRSPYHWAAFVLNGRDRDPRQ